MIFKLLMLLAAGLMGVGVSEVITRRRMAEALGGLALVALGLMVAMAAVGRSASFGVLIGAWLPVAAALFVGACGLALYAASRPEETENAKQSSPSLSALPSPKARGEHAASVAAVSNISGAAVGGAKAA